MNWAHLHLLLNHAPFWGVITGTLLLIAAMARNHGAWKDAAFWTLAMSGLAAFVVYVSGDPAAEHLQEVANYPKPLMDAHRDASRYAFGALTSLIAAGLAGALILPRDKEHGVSQLHTSGILLMALLSAVILAWVGHLGGKVVHQDHMGTPATLEKPS